MAIVSVPTRVHVTPSGELKPEKVLPLRTILTQ
jgi:hypothetical protein